MNQNWKYGILDDAVVKDSSNLSLNKIKGDEGDYPVFGAKGFVQNISFYQQEFEYLAIIKDGAGIGRVSRHAEKSSILATMQYLLPKKRNDIQFLKYFLNYIDFEKYRTGSTIPHIYYKDYKSEPYPLIDLPQQKRIVAILDQCFEVIDKAKANLERNLQNAKDLFQSQLNQIFTQKGEGWVEKKVDEISTVINGFSFKSTDFASTNEIKSIKITNVGVGAFVEESDNFLPKVFEDVHREMRIKSGDIVLALTRTIIASGLKVAMVPDSYDGALLNQRVAAIIPDDTQIDAMFLYLFFRTETVSEYVLANVNTLMQPNLSIKDLKLMPLPVPSLESQRNIVQKLGNLNDQTQSLESKYQHELEALDELNKSILQKAFNGEL